GYESDPYYVKDLSKYASTPDSDLAKILRYHKIFYVLPPPGAVEVKKAAGEFDKIITTLFRPDLERPNMWSPREFHNLIELARDTYSSVFSFVAGSIQSPLVMFHNIKNRGIHTLKSIEKVLNMKQDLGTWRQNYALMQQVYGFYSSSIPRKHSMELYVLQKYLETYKSTAGAIKGTLEIKQDSPLFRINSEKFDISLVLQFIRSTDMLAKAFKNYGYSMAQIDFDVVNIEEAEKVSREMLIEIAQKSKRSL
ncbi:hypothetical protein ROZALSC1DRAFT_21489, partial [Rozella allomycis CSF55]